MFIQKNLPVVSPGLVGKTLIAVLIGLMSGGVAVLAQKANAGGVVHAPSPAVTSAAAIATPAEAALQETATATTVDDTKKDAATGEILIPTATSEAERAKEAQEAADTQMDAATAKAVKKLADKFKGKKGKQPKLTPLDIEQGTLTVDGWTGKARMNYDIADLKYLFIWAPGVGTVVVSNGWFPQSDIQLNAFSGNMLTLTVKGHTIQIASDKRMLGKKPASAFVYVDTAYRFPSSFPVMGYGSSPLAPYAWPGATAVKGTLASVVAAPPLPRDLRPVLAPPGCPPPGSKQALNMTPCKLPVVPSASTATVASQEPVTPTP